MKKEEPTQPCDTATAITVATNVDNTTDTNTESDSEHSNPVGSSNNDDYDVLRPQIRRISSESKVILKLAGYKNRYDEGNNRDKRAMMKKNQSLIMLRKIAKQKSSSITMFRPRSISSSSSRSKSDSTTTSRRSSTSIDSLRVSMIEMKQGLSSRYIKPQRNLEKSLSQHTLLNATKKKKKKKKKQKMIRNEKRQGSSLCDDSTSHTITESTIESFAEEEEEEHRRCVRFSSVDIHWHPIIVGDNPGGTKGPPLTIGWQQCDGMEKYILEVEEYEKIREGHRRTHKDMQMKAKQRQRLLLDLGFSLREINDGTRVANVMRHQRRHTVATLDQQNVHKKIETFVRYARHVVTFGAKKRLEKKLFQDSMRASCLAAEQRRQQQQPPQFVGILKPT